jgi:tetratricopeptide (TPR) repeat protein
MVLSELTDILSATQIDDLGRPAEYQTLFHQTRQHFSRYFLGYAVSHCSDWEWLEVEQVNLLAATQYCWDTDDYNNLLAFRDVLQLYLDRQGHWTDSLRLNEWAIAAAHALGDRINATRFTHDRADILHQRGEYHQAERLYQACEQSYLHLGEKDMALRSRHMRALVLRAQGQLKIAERLCEATITEARERGLHSWLAHPLYVRALLARDRGDFQQARLCIEESLDRLTDSDELAMIAQCHHFLGELALLQRCLAEARVQVEKSLRLSRSVGILRRVAATQRLLGDVASAEGDYDEANDLYRAAFEITAQLGDQPQQARILLSQAQLAASLNYGQKAIGLLQSDLAIYQKVGDPRGIITTSLLLARLYYRQREFSLALHHGSTALRTLWKAKLLQPRVLGGIMRRRGN